MTDAHRATDGRRTERASHPTVPRFAGLTALHRDACWVLASESPATTARLAGALASYYGEPVGDDRLDATVDELVAAGLVDAEPRDGADATYRLTTAGRRALSRRRVWLHRRCADDRV